jgi:hypothetical protein
MKCAGLIPDRGYGLRDKQDLAGYFNLGASPTFQEGVTVWLGMVRAADPFLEGVGPESEVDPRRRCGWNGSRSSGTIGESSTRCDHLLRPES